MYSVTSELLDSWPNGFVCRLMVRMYPAIKHQGTANIPERRRRQRRGDTRMRCSQTASKSFLLDVCASGEINIDKRIVPHRTKGSVMNGILWTGRSELTGMKLASGISLICLSVFLAGCPASNPEPEPGRVATVIIRGSNTIGEELAPRLIGEYKKSHQSASFDLETKGTAYGMGALMADER